MFRVVLDSNVLISAAIRPSGPPGKIITALLTRNAFELVLSPAIVSEVEKALRLPKVRRYLRGPDDALLLVTDLVAIADLVTDTDRVSGACRDSADEIVLAAAVEGRARAIVTGDDDLISLAVHEGIAIMTPRAFLAFREL